MENCRLDILPVELVHHVLSYFSAHEIFYTFTNVTSYIDAILSAYSYYSINFKSISRKNFDLVCQYIKPDQVITLTLSDDKDTPGLVDLFLSRFQINQFTHLQSLILIDVGVDYWESIITKLIELKHLQSFRFLSSTRGGNWISNISGNDITQLDRRLFDSYAPILPQLYRLQLCHGDFLKSVQFPHLRHLILNRSSAKIFAYINSVASQLKSVETDLSDFGLLKEFTSPFTTINRLVLRTSYLKLSMNDMEQIMSNLPSLKHLELITDCHKDVVNGERWQEKVKCLTTFKFKFNLFLPLVSQDLDSFRTPFWIEEKRWFVAYESNSLFSIPYFNRTEANGNFELPSYSTALDNEIFYKSIDKLDITTISNYINHYFPEVQTLRIGSSIDISDIEKIVNLTRIQHLILHFSMKNFPIMTLIDKIPNLRQITLKHNVIDFLKQVNGEKIEKVKTLEINNCLQKTDNDTIPKLSNVFPNIEHLHIAHQCSIAHIFYFLSEFQHLSTASFRYAAMSNYSEEAGKYRRKTEKALEGLRHRQGFDYTYRFDFLTVFMWIR